MKLVLPFMAGLISVFALACGGNDNGPNGAAVDDITAEDVLERSADAVADVESFRFELTHENGTTPLPLNLQLVSADGVVAVPDAMQADVRARAAGVSVNVEIIGVDGRTWVTNPFTRRWESLRGTDIRDFADPAAVVERVLPLIQDPELRGTTTMGGVNTYEVHGNIDSADLQTALGVAEPGRVVDVEAWFGVDDYLPRRVRLIGPLTSGEQSNVVRQVDLSNYNQAVSIEPPE